MLQSQYNFKLSVLLIPSVSSVLNTRTERNAGSHSVVSVQQRSVFVPSSVNVLFVANSRALALPPVLERPPENWQYRILSEGVDTVGEFGPIAFRFRSFLCFSNQPIPTDGIFIRLKLQKSALYGISDTLC